MSDELWYLDASELAQVIATREMSPVDIVDAHLSRIESINPKINAIVEVVESATEKAKQAERKQLKNKEPLGPLHGVPFTIKDCIDTAGIRTTRGSRLFQHHLPSRNATVVQRLEDAGGILIGKTNMPEFALWWESDNVLFGRTLNPWNIDRTPGGSSGGEAASLSAGLSPLGIGSDVGGSIRNPAHHCGIVGLKPTHGRVPLTGHWPETLLRAMHVGPMARSVRDISLALGIISGPDGLDPYAIPIQSPSPETTDMLPSFKVGWNASHGFGPVDPVVKQAVRDAAVVMSKAGCHVEEVALPGLENRDTQVISMTVYSAEAGLYLSPVVNGREDELSPNIQKRLSLPRPRFDEYLESIAEWEWLKQDMSKFFREYDLLLCPSVPVPAHPHGITELVVSEQTVPARNALRATIPWDLTGSPALSVPFTKSLDGLPIGVQIVGRHFAEQSVLQAGLFLEQNNGQESWRPLI